MNKPLSLNITDALITQLESLGAKVNKFDDNTFSIEADPAVMPKVMALLQQNAKPTSDQMPVDIGMDNSLEIQEHMGNLRSAAHQMDNVITALTMDEEMEARGVGFDLAANVVMRFVSETQVVIDYLNELYQKCGGEECPPISQTQLFHFCQGVDNCLGLLTNIIDNAIKVGYEDAAMQCSIDSAQKLKDMEQNFKAENDKWKRRAERAEKKLKALIGNDQPEGVTKH